MNRTQKKCLFASAGMHALLVCVVVFGAGFLAGRAPEPVTILEMIPANAILTDGATRGGGNPRVTQPPAAAAAQPPAAPAASPAPPAPAPPKTETPKAKAPVVEPEPPKVSRTPDNFALPKDNPKSTSKKADTAKTAKKTAKNTKPVDTKDLLGKEVVRNPGTGSSTSKSTSKSSRKTDSPASNEAVQREIAGRIGKSVDFLSGALSTGVGVEMPGPGGAAFINYRDLIASAYQRRYEQLLLTAGDIAKGDTDVDVAITIARDGRVTDRRITRKSPNTKLNQLVEKVLSGISQIAPFPPEAKDASRTFNLTFDLKSKRFTG